MSADVGNLDGRESGIGMAIYVVHVNGCFGIETVVGGKGNMPLGALSHRFEASERFAINGRLKLQAAETMCQAQFAPT